jgi:hypothetical protein
MCTVTVQTGLITSVLATVDLIVYLVDVSNYPLFMSTRSNVIYRLRESEYSWVL